MEYSHEQWSLPWGLFPLYTDLIGPWVSGHACSDYQLSNMSLNLVSVLLIGQLSLSGFINHNHHQMVPKYWRLRHVVWTMSIGRKGIQLHRTCCALGVLSSCPNTYSPKPFFGLDQKEGFYVKLLCQSGYHLLLLRLGFLMPRCNGYITNVTVTLHVSSTAHVGYQNVLCF